MTDLGGDLTIGDGHYCDHCPVANALECMAIAPCPRRDRARLIKREQDRALALAGQAIQTAWDSCPTLPPIDFTDEERELLARAALSHASGGR